MPLASLADAPTTVLLRLLSAPQAEDAWCEFVKRYWSFLVEWARRGDVRLHDAEDIACEVLLKLSQGRALATFDRSRGRSRSWLRGVVHHAALDYREARQKAFGDRNGKGLQEPIDALLDPASLDDLVEDLDARICRDLEAAEAVIEKVQARVNPSTWEAYYRTAILGEQAGPVADDLNLTVAAVYMAKNRVGTMLAEEGQAVLG
ncbi:MAG TPA: sigma-70 family RNA polymerase sigma factor [Gemmataceae bacterium]|nr:sigma-70 family RNA polymerase sigma factor [Gemmataceae bacterium]